MKRTFCVALFAFISQAVQGEAYLFLQGIDGDSSDPAHKGWIDIGPFQFGVHKTGLGAAGFSVLSVSKTVESSSPELSLRVGDGRAIPSAKVELFRFIGQQRVRYYMLTLSNLLVFRVAEHHAEPSAMETVDFTYEWLSWSYVEFDVNANQVGSPFATFWDLARNTGGYSDAFRVTGIVQNGTNVVVTWPGEPGRTYNILTSTRVTGPYAVARTVTSTFLGPQSATFPASFRELFFSIEKR